MKIFILDKDADYLERFRHYLGKKYTQLQISICDNPDAAKKLVLETTFDVVLFSAEFDTLKPESFGIDSENHFFYDILGENLNAELEDASDILLLGETDLTWIAWLKKENSHAIVDKDTQMVLHKLDNFTNAVRYVLQIDD